MALKELLLLARLSTAAKGSTAAGTPTSSAVDANTQALHVQITGRDQVGTRAYDWSSLMTLAVGETSAATSAVGAAGEYEIAADTDCYIMVGNDPEASPTTSRYLPAGAAFTLQLAATDKVAAIRRDEDGTLTVLPVA